MSYRLGHAFTAPTLYNDFCARVERVLASLTRQRIYETGSRVFSVGENSRGVLTLLSGRAFLVARNAEGREIGGREAAAGEVFGITEMLSGVPFEAELRTVSDCEFEFVSEEDYVDALSREPEICFQLLRKLSQRYRDFIATLV